MGKIYYMPPNVRAMLRAIQECPYHSFPDLMDSVGEICNHWEVGLGWVHRRLI